MNLVLRAAGRALVSLTDEELLLLSKALNEVCNGVEFEEPEFLRRVGIARSDALDILRKISALTEAPHTSDETCATWADSGSLMVKAMTVYGDPVELSERDAEMFLVAISAAAKEAK